MSVKCLVIRDPACDYIKTQHAEKQPVESEPCTVKALPKENTLLSIMSFIFESGLKLLSTYKLIGNREKEKFDAVIDLECGKPGNRWRNTSHRTGRDGTVQERNARG